MMISVSKMSEDACTEELHQLESVNNLKMPEKETIDELIKQIKQFLENFNQQWPIN